MIITATLFYIAERLKPSAGVTAAKRTPPSMSTHASDHTEKPQPDPVEDPTGRGTLGQFAKRGAEGVQVLADKMTGQESSRYNKQQPGCAISRIAHQLCTRTSPFDADQSYMWYLVMCAAVKVQKLLNRQRAKLSQGMAYTLLHIAVELSCQHATAFPRQVKSLNSGTSLTSPVTALTTALIAMQGESCP